MQALERAVATGRQASSYFNGIIDRTYGTVESFGLNDTNSIYESGNNVVWLWPSELPKGEIIYLLHNTMTDDTFHRV